MYILTFTVYRKQSSITSAHNLIDSENIPAGQNINLLLWNYVVESYAPQRGEHCAVDDHPISEVHI